MAKVSQSLRGQRCKAVSSLTYSVNVAKYSLLSTLVLWKKRVQSYLFCFVSVKKDNVESL